MFVFVQGGPQAVSPQTTVSPYQVSLCRTPYLHKPQKNYDCATLVPYAPLGGPGSAPIATVRSCNSTWV